MCTNCEPLLDWLIEPVLCITFAKVWHHVLRLNKVCQLLFSMKNDIKVVRKELNTVTKLINEITLCNKLLKFLINFFELLLWGFSSVFHLVFILIVMHYFFPLVVIGLMYRNKLQEVSSTHYALLTMANSET